MFLFLCYESGGGVVWRGWVAWPGEVGLGFGFFRRIGVFVRGRHVGGDLGARLLFCVCFVVLCKWCVVLWREKRVLCNGVFFVEGVSM